MRFKAQKYGVHTNFEERHSSLPLWISMDGKRFDRRSCFLLGHEASRASMNRGQPCRDDLGMHLNHSKTW